MPTSQLLQLTKRFHALIVEAFQVQDLKEALYLGLGTKLDEVATLQGSLRAISFELIMWADRQGMLLRLAQTLAAERSNRTDFARLVAELTVELDPEAVTSTATTPFGPIPGSAPAPEVSAVSLADLGNQPIIYVAEPTPDLRGRNDRKAVADALMQAGFRILPEAPYDRDIADYKIALDRDLPQALLFVQVLGESGTPISAEPPFSYEGLQFARAKAAGCPCLRWRPGDAQFDLAAIRELAPDHYRYLTDEAPVCDIPLLDDERVLAGYLEDFRHTIEVKVQKILAQRTKSLPAGVEQRILLLSPQKIDDQLAEQFDELIRQQGARSVLSDIADEQYSLTQLYGNEAGVVVIYGRGSYDWIEERVRQCREIAVNRGENPPVCAIYIGPPDPQRPLKKRPARFHVIRAGDRPALAQYLAEVWGPKGSAP